MDDVLNLIDSLTQTLEGLSKTVKDLEESVITFESEMELLSKEMMEVCQLQAQFQSIIRYIANRDNVAEFEVSG